MTRRHETPCPACGATLFAAAFAAREMFGGERFTLARCAACGLLRTADALEEEQLARYYHFQGGADAGARLVPWLEPLARALRRGRVRAVLRSRPAPGRILDVGCGRGIMLRALADRGWDVYGTEVDRSVAESAMQRLAGRVQIGQVQDLVFPAAPFDVVTFWHVLEHLPDPYGALRRVAKLLAPGGAVIVALPNVDSWQARLTHRHWLHLDVPRHRWHFSPVTLGRLAGRVGLRVVRLRQFSLEYGPYGLWQSLVARTGLGHFLFTDVLRPTVAGKLSLLTAPRFWAHAALAGPIGAAALASLPLEIAAAVAGAGGAVTATLEPIRGVRRRPDGCSNTRELADQSSSALERNGQER